MLSRVLFKMSIGCIMLLSTMQLAAEDIVKITGLERLYFEISDPSSYKLCPEQLQELLPASIDGKLPSIPEDSLEISPCDEWKVSDFSLPLTDRHVILREVRDFNHPRIHNQSWCLYQNNRRTECFFFSPEPERTENKTLAPLFIQRIFVNESGNLVFRAFGRMDRPQGAYWWQNVDLVFEMKDLELRFEYVVRRARVFQDYTRPDGETPAPSIAFEKVVKSNRSIQILERRIENVQPSTLRRCGIRDSYDIPPDELERLADCFKDPSAKLRYRELTEPSFIERGWKEPSNSHN